MAIFTPTGLKIRLPVAYAFALIGVPPLAYLRCDTPQDTGIGIRSPPSVYFSVASPGIMFDVRPLYIGLIGAGVYGINSWIRNSPVFLLVEVAIGTLYSYVAIWGIPFILLAVLAFLTGG